MIEQDTIRLLRECYAGVKMGTESIDEVMDRVEDEELKRTLSDCKREHNALEKELDTLLEKYKEEGKMPNPMARAMSWMKTEAMLAMDKDDATIADLMTDGCNMGVKSLNKYLNEYKAADEVSKDITKRLINLEEKLAHDLRKYL